MILDHNEIVLFGLRIFPFSKTHMGVTFKQEDENILNIKEL